MLDKYSCSITHNTEENRPGPSPDGGSVLPPHLRQATAAGLTQHLQQETGLNQGRLESRLFV